MQILYVSVSMLGPRLLAENKNPVYEILLHAFPMRVVSVSLQITLVCRVSQHVGLRSYAASLTNSICRTTLFLRS